MLGRNPHEWELNPDGVEQDDSWSCNICKMSMLAFTKMISLDATQQVINDYVGVTMCGALLPNKTMCDGIVN